MGKTLALLVGIDHYPSGGRLRSDGRPVRINNLQGCVNDVTIIAELLSGFGFHDPTILTSPTSLSSADNPSAPQETDTLPTFTNIQNNFDRLLKTTEKGDILFFHFSGHGAPLLRIRGSPSDGREHDPSLLPMDYCSGERAIRGWELNNILKRFHDQGVHVVVSLDSCHSGGSWRDDAAPVRTPDEWKPPPNLPSDEATDDFLSGLPDGHRHGTLEKSWDINPDGFVLMAACTEDQKAAETRSNPKHGAFTYELCQHLKSRAGQGRPTYRSICDYINTRLNSTQTPQAFGQDKLVFLETKEMFVKASVQAIVQGNNATLPIGKAHGVKRGAVFINRCTVPNVLLTVEKVEDFESEGVLDGELGDAIPEFVPYQWYSENDMKVFVDTTLGGDFRTALKRALQDRIASNIEVKDGIGSVQNTTLGAIQFQLQRTIDGIEILAPTLGHGPLYCLGGEDNGVRSADALAHLFRFQQVHSLVDETSTDTPQFTASLDATSSRQAPFTKGRRVKYAFSNKDQCCLYFTVLNISPGFNIQQMFPANDEPMKMPPGTTRSFSVTLKLPEELLKVSANQERPYRDIIRTMVTRGKPLPFKNMELPDIWNADLMGIGLRKESPRDARHAGADSASDFAWWIMDIEVFTKQ